MSNRGRQAIPLTIRTMVGLLGVGAATLFAVTYWFDLSREELLQFLAGTLVFIVAIIMLAGALVLLVKLPGILRQRRERRRQRENGNRDGS